MRFCRWLGGKIQPVATCDARMDYVMGKYAYSPEEAFEHVMERAECKRKPGVFYGRV